MLVSIDIGSFEDALNAYERIVEIREKEKYFDEEILTIIVKAVEGNIPDVNGVPAGRLKKKTIDLLARLTVQNPSQGITSELSVKLTDSPLLKAQKLQNAYRGYVSVSGPKFNYIFDSNSKISILEKFELGQR